MHSESEAHKKSQVENTNIGWLYAAPPIGGTESVGHLQSSHQRQLPLTSKYILGGLALAQTLQLSAPIHAYQMVLDY